MVGAWAHSAPEGHPRRLAARKPSGLLPFDERLGSLDDRRKLRFNRSSGVVIERQFRQHRIEKAGEIQRSRMRISRPVLCSKYGLALSETAHQEDAVNADRKFTTGVRRRYESRSSAAWR